MNSLYFCINNTNPKDQYAGYYNSNNGDNDDDALKNSVTKEMIQFNGKLSRLLLLLLCCLVRHQIH
ncbi:hypothetical protein DERF_001634 [Dermatophagoides farinae]|uniref:Uncharacterized protein n=1 Tax=Dermatophagoides farinae TaxID=6954 RepID=A0A922I9V0_DERFA|nr:hypothetical protein DERF_001634 [Dermatophagoides farinae]